MTTESADDILIVEDNGDLAEVMAIVLHGAGYATRHAADGRAALEAAARKRPALVLLDMLMPVMNGWECARALRQRYGHSIPVVVVTAADHARARAEEVRADDVLAKPFDMGELLRIVRRFMH